MRIAIAAAAASALIASVVSANAANEFYIVLDESKGRCELVTVPPQTTALDLLADGVVFFDQQQAQRKMHSLEECARTELSSRITSTSRN